MREQVELLPRDKRAASLRIAIEAWIDRGYGCCVLREPEAARLVQNSFLFNDGTRYRLIAWVIMPNHVHVMFEPFDDWPLQKIVGTWRSYTGRRLSPMMPEESVVFGNERRVWQPGYWDRYIRTEEHYQKALGYIHRNPVKAGLVERPEDWRWSSAWPGRWED